MLGEMVFCCLVNSCSCARERDCNDQSADIVNPQFAELMSGVGRARLHAERRCTRGEQQSVSVTVTVACPSERSAHSGKCHRVFLQQVETTRTAEVFVSI